MIEKKELVPPLKWAGGKRWFVTNYRHLIPDSYDGYIEPFVGSGALFFTLRPKQAILADVNPELINLYSVIRSDPYGMQRKLLRHQRLHSKEYFYYMRKSVPRSELGRAARFLYLNRTCWNGLYRVNAQGKFNVPIGTKTSVVMDTDDFEALGGALNGVSLLCSDFEAVVDRAQKNDFVFVDPPYTVAHNFNGFVKYNEVLFSWGDQERLMQAVSRAVRRGAKVLVTNAAHDSVRALYAGFEQMYVSRSGVIAGKASARGNFQELVIRCY
jgi:DNA adenine methylase